MSESKKQKTATNVVGNAEHSWASLRVEQPAEALDVAMVGLIAVHSNLCHLISVLPTCCFSARARLIEQADRIAQTIERTMGLPDQKSEIEVNPVLFRHEIKEPILAAR